MAARDDTDSGGRGAWRWVLVKLAISATLLTIVVRRLSWPELRAELSQASLPALLVPLALLVAGNVLGALQWGWILRSAGVVVGAGRLVRAYMIGLFLNNFTLGSLGGEVFKIYSVGREAGATARVAGATIVDRLVGLGALCTLALVAACFGLVHVSVRAEQTLAVASFSLIVMGTAAVLLHPRWGAALARAARRIPFGAWGDRTGRMLDHLGDFRGRPRVLNGAFLLSLVIQSSRVTAHFCVGLAMGWTLHASDLVKFFLVVPILGLLIALPVSVGGWGVREWAGVALFAPLGRDAEEAVALLALTATLTLLASIVGAAALVWRTR